MNEKIIKPIRIRRPWYFRGVSAVLVATMLATSAPAWADPPAPPPAVTAPTPPPVISPLNKGQPSPFTGVLFSPEAVAAMIAQKDTASAAAQLAVQHQKELDDAAMKYAIDSAATTCTTDKNILSAQITDAQKQNKILPGAPVWIGLGFAGGVVVTVITAFAVSKATH